MSAAEQTDERLDLTMMFVGVVDNGKKYYAWIELPDNDADADMSYTYLRTNRGVYTKQIQKSASPGSIYTMKATRKDDDGLSVGINSGTYVGMYHDNDLVTRLQAEHHAIDGMFKAKGKAARERATRLDLERLEPLRQAYWNMGAAQRNVFLAQCIGFITKPTTYKKGK